MTPLAEIVARVLDTPDVHYVNGLVNIDFEGTSILPAVEVSGPYVVIDEGDPTAQQVERIELIISVPDSDRRIGTAGIDLAIEISLAIRERLDDVRIDSDTDTPLRHVAGNPTPNDYGVVQWTDVYQLTRQLPRCPL